MREVISFRRNFMRSFWMRPFCFAVQKMNIMRNRGTGKFPQHVGHWSRIMKWTTCKAVWAAWLTGNRKLAAYFIDRTICGLGVLALLSLGKLKAHYRAIGKAKTSSPRQS